MTAAAEEPKKSGRGGKRVPKPGNHIGRPALAGAGAGISRMIGVRLDEAREEKVQRLQAATGLSMSGVLQRLIDDCPDPLVNNPTISKEDRRATRADPNVPEPSPAEVAFLRRSHASGNARDQRVVQDLIGRYPAWAKTNGFC